MRCWVGRVEGRTARREKGWLLTRRERAAGGREVGNGCTAGWKGTGLLGGRQVGGLQGCAAGQERGGQRLRCWVGGDRLLGGRVVVNCWVGERWTPKWEMALLLGLGGTAPWPDHFSCTPPSTGCWLLAELSSSHEDTATIP